MSRYVCSGMCVCEHAYVCAYGRERTPLWMSLSVRLLTLVLYFPGQIAASLLSIQCWLSNCIQERGLLAGCWFLSLHKSKSGQGCLSVPEDTSFPPLQSSLSQCCYSLWKHKVPNSKNSKSITPKGNSQLLYRTQTPNEPVETNEPNLQACILSRGWILGRPDSTQNIFAEWLDWEGKGPAGSRVLLFPTDAPCSISTQSIQQPL